MFSVQLLINIILKKKKKERKQKLLKYGYLCSYLVDQTATKT